MFEKFALFPYARFIGLSANNQDRQDGADFELEGFFGPLVAEMSYQEAEANGLVVAIEVHWHNVFCDDYGSDLEGVQLNKFGLWRNDDRNAVIAKVARQYDREEQVLITCKTLEHACYLKYHLPEFKLCYAPSDGNQESIDGYKEEGLVPMDTRVMTIDRLQKLRRMFERGKLRKVIATTVWNRGVDFVGLGVLIRADGGSSATDDTQIPGRLSRVKSGKQAGILHDFRDQFNDTLRGKARRRKSDYNQKGWQQIEPTDDAGSSEIRKNVLGLQ
jgi:superfamily II DNA or RNA helicase